MTYRIAASIIARRLEYGDKDVKAARAQAIVALTQHTNILGLIIEQVDLALERMTPDTELARYHRLLAIHDWAYEFSDDHRVWRAGRDARAVLESMSAHLDQQKIVWRLYDPH